MVEVFHVIPPKKRHLQFAVLSRVFKFRTFIPLGVLSPKIAMLLLISDGVIIVIRMISVFRDTDLATFIYLVVDILIFRIVR